MPNQMSENQYLDECESTEPIEYATYDADDNKLRIYSGRVSQELYEQLKELGYGRAYKQGCFYATWTPRREDIALELCGEIDDEDSTLMDRAEGRQERFATYSTNAGQRKQDAWDASRKATEGIPFGQPILVGHHSERRHRNAIERSRQLSARGMNEYHKENYWQRRAAGSLSHAQRTFKPGVIYRRIKKLQAELRKYQRMIDPNGKEWARDKEWAYSFHKKTVYEVNQMWMSRAAHYTRWIAHTEGRIGYWQAIYKEVGGVKADRNDWPLEVGGWVLGRSGWGQVKRITRRDGEVLSVSLDRTTLKESWWPHVVKYPEIKDYRTDDPR